MIIKVILVRCDVCAETIATDVADVTSARRDVRERGWRVNLEEGRMTDLCPTCYEKKMAVHRNV